MNAPARLRPLLAPALLACALTAAGGSALADATPPAPAPDGAAIYQENCATCHRRGKAGSPVITNLDDWAPHVAKGRDTLVKNAIKGVTSPAGDEMPARGGNDDLTDAEVAAAVDYILSQVTAPKP